MYNFSEILAQGYDTNSGKPSLLCTVYADTAAGFPIQDADYHFVLGCKGVDAATGDKYLFNGSTWNKIEESPFRDVYTKNQIDAMIDQIDQLDARQTAALADLIDDGVKNRLPITTRIGPSNATAAATYTQAGVKFTANGDGTITIERLTANTNQAGVWLYDDSSAILVDDYADGTFEFSNGYVGSSTTARMRLSQLYEGGYLYIDEYDKIPDKGSLTGINVSIVVYPTFTGTAILKPMICRQSYWQITNRYRPYLPSLQEIWQAARS